MRIQLNTVTNIAMAHDPIPQASPTTTTRIAFPVKLGIIEHGPKTKECAYAEDDKCESLVASAQLSNDCSDHSEKDQRFAFFQVRQGIHQGCTARMPRDNPRASHRQAQAKEESQQEFRMRKLLQAVLNRLPRTPLGIRGPNFRHLFSRICSEGG